MANLDLRYGITVAVEIVHNLSYETLFAEETKESHSGLRKGQVTELGAVNVMTGRLHRSFSQKINSLKDETSENTVWWTSEEYKTIINL